MVQDRHDYKYHYSDFCHCRPLSICLSASVDYHIDTKIYDDASSNARDHTSNSIDFCIDPWTGSQIFLHPLIFASSPTSKELPS